ncbi:sensor histidine kinase [Neptunomonas antarctica]|uniref:histidine kinase n=1 Tax=Neptunomonas antarctica TaxID=619304 RepID=A0A1N7LPH2_9GAMM|nr:ATP-binding protein [Neptunomonas antarctica]SIS75591.1 Histidine kinase-, DNA gyrase B-, and HSP90-like ATPase [Neptunomonas antarctica]
MHRIEKSLQRLRKNVQLLAVVMLCGVVLVSVLVYQTLLQQKVSNLMRQQENQQIEAMALLHRELGNITNLANLLYKNRALQKELSVNRPTVDIAAVNDLFIEFGIAVGDLQQVRWLDSSGMERARVDWTESSDDKMAWSVSSLQDKSNRYYVINALQMPPSEVYISSIDLNIEHGRVVEPYDPTVRAGIRTGEGDGLVKGLLLINYHLNELLARIRALNSSTMRITLVDSEGYWIVNPMSSMQWGRDLQQPDNNLQKQQPDLWQSMLKNPTQIDMHYNNTLVSYQRINLSHTDIDDKQSRVYLMTETPATVMWENKRDALIPTIFLALMFFLFNGALLRRDYRFRLSLLKLNQQLANEKAELSSVNETLGRTLEQQQMLQDDLVESRKLSSLGMMVAGVAHELNTPIGGALIAITSQHERLAVLSRAIEEGLTRKMLDDYLSNAEQGIVLAESNLNRSANLVKRFKRLAIDRVSEDIVKFQLKQVVDDLLLSLHSRLKTAGVDAVFHSEKPITLCGYPGILSQILQNLIDNAMIHGLDQRRGARIVLAARVVESQVELTVTDNGSGIELDILDTIFDPFVTSNRSDGSTGLGLHLVHQWVTQLMSGSIRTETPEEGGCRFVIRFPTHVPAEQASMPSGTASSVF